MAEWLDESRISPESQFLFYVDIFGTPIRNNSMPTKYQLHRTIITDGTLEGKAPKARRGKFSFIDPEGIWPQILANAGAWSNSLAGKGKPNLICYFGWTNLKPGGEGRSTEILNKLSGLILKTRFSVDEITAITTIEVEFIEAVSSWFSGLRFLDPNDMIILDEIRNRDLAKMSVSKLLQFIWDNSSIGLMVEASELDFNITFEETGSDHEIDGRKYKIRYGDSLQQKIDEISAQAAYTVKGEDKDPDKVYSYEIIKKEDNLEILGDGDSVNMNYSASVGYGWKEAPLEDSEEDSNIENIWKDNPPEDGPNLMWKIQSKGYNKKQMISWNSNLNSKEYLIHQAQEELTEKLSSYSESDWDALQKFIKTLKEEQAGQITQESMASALERVKNQSNEGRSGFFQRIFNNADWQMASGENRLQMFESMVNDPLMALRASGDPGSQMSAIISNNVFKGEATILGDPYFGTEILPFRMKMTMAFEDVGEFATLFQRDWILTNVTHIFNESGYTTRLEILTYPTKQEVNINMDEAAAKVGEQIMRDARGNPIGMSSLPGPPPRDNEQPSDDGVNRGSRGDVTNPRPTPPYRTR